MAAKSEYKYKPASTTTRIDALAAADSVSTTNAFDWWRKMHNETFKTSDYGFTDKSEILYLSSSTKINGGTWGKALYSAIENPYKYEDLESAFVDAVKNFRGLML